MAGVRKVSIACAIQKSGLIIAEAMPMSSMSDEPHVTARVSASLSQDMRALQAAMLESARFFTEAVRRFAHDWQTRWPDPQITQELAEIGESLLVTLAGLEEEFGQPGVPSRQRVDRLLDVLLGTQTTRGPLQRLLNLAQKHAAPSSLADQRLQSEVDTLFIQLNGLLAQWRDYQALATNLEPAPDQHAAKTPPRSRIEREASEAEEASLLSLPARHTTGQPTERRRGGTGDLLWALLPILLAGVVILVLVSGIVSRLSQHQEYPAAPVTSGAQSTPTAPPPGTAVPAPSATTPARLPRLSVTPTTLLLPCPGTGAANLQLSNTGAVALNWQAAIISASGGQPGILLDGENTETGHLNPGAVTEISVTAQLRGAQGSLSISYSGEPAPILVPYSLNC